MEPVGGRLVPRLRLGQLGQPTDPQGALECQTFNTDQRRTGRCSTLRLDSETNYQRHGVKSQSSLTPCSGSSRFCGQFESPLSCSRIHAGSVGSPCSPGTVICKRGNRWPYRWKSREFVLVGTTLLYYAFDRPNEESVSFSHGLSWLLNAPDKASLRSTGRRAPGSETQRRNDLVDPDINAEGNVATTSPGGSSPYPLASTAVETFPISNESRFLPPSPRSDFVSLRSRVSCQSEMPVAPPLAPSEVMQRQDVSRAVTASIEAATDRKCAENTSRLLSMSQLLGCIVGPFAAFLRRRLAPDPLFTTERKCLQPAVELLQSLKTERRQHSSPRGVFPIGCATQCVALDEPYAEKEHVVLLFEWSNSEAGVWPVDRPPLLTSFEALPAFKAARDPKWAFACNSQSAADAFVARIREVVGLVRTLDRRWALRGPLIPQQSARDHPAIPHSLIEHTSSRMELDEASTEGRQDCKGDPHLLASYDCHL